MRYGSVCSGIEAATVAWHGLGWAAAWYSEIEPFPCAVLAHHYPDVPNHGDMTLLPERILAGEVEAPDLLCGGTPCQAFSVAGQRRSLDDARGNLSLTFCEVADAIDTVRLARGDDPAIIVWENVPGVLNTKDNAFGCFLAQLAGEDEALDVEKWPRAGVVDGRRRRVAWAVLDAQYFGLAQRRRRVFVLAVAQETVRHAGNRADPAAILSLGTCLRRDTPSRSEPRQGAAAGAGRCFAGGRESDVAATLETTAHDYSRADGFTVCFHPVGSDPIHSSDGTTHAMTCGSAGGSASVAVAYEAKDGRPLDCSPTLDARLADGPRRNQGGVIALDAHNQSLTGDVSNTVTSRDDQDTASLVATFDSRQPHNPQPSSTAQLTTKNCAFVRGDSPLVAQVAPTVYTLAIRGRGEDRNLEIRQDGTANALLTPNGGRDGIGVGAIAVATRPIAMRESGQGYWMQDDIAGTLRAEGENRPSRPSHVIGTPPLRAGAHAPTIAFHPIASDPLYCEEGTTHAMTCGNRSGTASIAVAFPIISDADRANSSATTPSPDAIGRVRLRDPGLGVGHDGDPMFTLTASKPHAVGTTSMQVEGFVSVDVYNGTITGDCAPTVTSASGPTKTGPSFMHAMAVRRLTPRECERLQGFPDDYTQIPLRGKPADQCPDGPRYKAIGNSWAVPVVRWIGERIADANNPQSTPTVGATA